MSDQSVTKELKILKEDINYYIVDPNQSIAALTNYHKNKRIDTYLETSNIQEIEVGKKTYRKKQYLSSIEFKTLFGIQREIERINSDLMMVNLQAQSINKRLAEHGEKLSKAELNTWGLEWDRLGKKYDTLADKLEKATDRGREMVLLYCFKIPKQVFLDNYTELLDLADGNFMTIINLFDREDPTRVKDVISPMFNQKDV